MNRGFTLAELILVVIVLTLVIGIVAPRFSDAVPAARLSRASTEMRAVIQKVRADAVILVRSYQLNLDPDAGTYWVTVEEDPLKAPGEYVQAGGPLRDVFQLPSGVLYGTITGAPASTTGTSYVFTFKPDGTVEGGSIVVSIPDGPSRTLTIDGATSDVEVSE